MNSELWLPLLSMVLSVGVPLAIFLARNWLLALISRSVQHAFDLKIEEVRTELRKNEERFKSDLRDKEAEISVLRNNVLSGSASRQSLLDKRRFEAVERVWTAVNDMTVYKTLASMMAVLNFKAVAKQASDPKIQQFLSLIGHMTPDTKEIKNVARDEQPFLPELAWAYFSAYTTIVMGSYMRFQVLKVGIDDADKFLTNDAVKKILKAALPQQSKFIDEQEPETYYYLLEEVEASLLAELRKIVEGADADQAATKRAKEIMEAINKVEAERAQQVVVGAQNIK